MMIHNNASLALALNEIFLLSRPLPQGPFFMRNWRAIRRRAYKRRRSSGLR